MASATSRVRDEALEVGRGWSGPDAPATWRLTAALFETLARDDALLELASAIPPERLPALLFVAAVQHVALRTPADPFAAYFPTPGATQPTVDDRFGPRYRSFCLEHRDELAAVLRRHRYQMNEVARCTQVALALGVLGRLAPERPVALVDVGTGAGFGLLPDRYGYRLSDGTRFGRSASAVQLTCELTDHRSPGAPRLPEIVHRVGIDVSPIDLDDPESRAWLNACLPPELGALTRARAATAVVRAERPTIASGTAAAVLPDVLRALPEGVVTCVVDAYTAVFLAEKELRALEDLLAAHARRHDTAWISLDPLVPLGTEARRTVQGADAPDRLVAANRAGGVFGVLAIRARVAGEETERLLATAHPSGTRMEWLDPTRAA